jgi:hypothetical protein
MSQLSIRVEPVADPTGRQTMVPSEQGSVLVGLIAEPGPVATEPPDLIEPIVGFRNWRIFRDGHAPGRLSSPYFPVSWSTQTLRAECHRLRTAEDLLREQHAAPAPHCGCGISAYHAPTGEFSKVDYRGVSGIVTVWGRIEVDSEGMRAEHARVEALASYSRWSRAQRGAVAEVADELGVDVVDLRELGAAAGDYGEPLPAALLRSERSSGVRERFMALLGSRVDD